MMALTISSIPVHREYYQNRMADAAHGLKYASALGVILLLGFAVLLGFLHLPQLAMNSVLVWATVFLFLIEKLADEISRVLEFRKHFLSWFLAQALRSGWLLVPLAASAAGATYILSFLIVSILMAGAFLFFFVRVIGFVPLPRLKGFSLIRGNLVFLAGAFLAASHRQVPRILVARLFPEFAHIYLAIAQLAQGAALIFNVRYQIPYRKVIVRKTALFQKLKHPLMVRMLVFPAIIAPLCILGLRYVPMDDFSQTEMAIVLAPVLIADALVAAILAAHLGYLTWFADRKSAFFTYLIALAIPLAVLLLFCVLPIDIQLTVFSLAGISILVGITWIAVIVGRHFRVPSRGKA
ncbi:hypothetical protein [Parasphingorhabdus sp.]|uniref:hypothetical protein n=1 Tax=Parasphingorhabdus sp. TaxID=2709688 RepID=UPI0032643028